MKTAPLAAALMLLAPLLWSAPAQGAASRQSRMVRIPGGAFRPMFDARTPRRIAAFDMDAAAVTNREYLAFVREHPEWRRSRARPLFVDEAYLREWTDDLDPGAGAPLDAPVVSVSWFAARAYLRAQHKQLPTVEQWDYAASLVPVRGIAQMGGPLREWTLDFNAALVSGESRADRSLDRTLYCGAGMIGAADLTDYAAFLRFAFRSSLDARYSLPNLGFRGVRVVEGAGR